MDYLQKWLSMPHPPTDDITVPPDVKFERVLQSAGDHFCAGWLFKDGDKTRWYGPLFGVGITPEAAIDDVYNQMLAK